MSIYSPARDWFKAPAGPERTWLALALAWCIAMTIVMPWWHFKGKQNSTGESYATTPREFIDRVTRFVDANKVGEEHGVPIVAPAPGADVYLLAKMWSWSPILKLKVGQQYRLHVSSQDLQHGFSLM